MADNNAGNALFIVSEEGFWAEECYIPLQTLRDNGFEITVATPSGMEPVVDESSLDPEEVGEEMAEDLSAMHATEEAIDNPELIMDVNMADFDVVVFPGGHGTVFDVNIDRQARDLLVDAVEQDDTYALIICHAVGLLGFTRHDDGTFVADGRNVTGFPNAWEEDIVDSGERLPNGVKLPYRVEDEVKDAGANWDAELDRDSSVAVDGSLVTARGPKSSEEGIETLIDLVQGGNTEITVESG